MKRAICLGIMLSFVAAGPKPESKPGKQQPEAAAVRCVVPVDDAALRRIAEEWKESYYQGNAAAVAALYTPDAIYLTQHFATGIVEGRAAIQAYVQRGVDAKYRVDNIEVLRTDCAGDMAYAVDRYTSTNAGQKAVGVNLVVVRKIGGQWRIVAHEAAVPDPATAVQSLDLPKN